MTPIDTPRCAYLPVDTLVRVRTRQPLSTPARTALRLAGLLAVLAGLLGMHGLANHGVSGMEAMPRAVIAEAASGLVSAAGADVDHSAARLPVFFTSNVDAAPGGAALVSPLVPEGMDMSMVGMCLAMLVAGIGAFLLSFRRRRAAGTLWCLPRLNASVIGPGRDPDPPPLTVLSIQRC